MFKVQLSVIILMAALYTAADCQQQPTLYPGAVKATRGEETGFASGEQYSVSVYYTKDSYQDVRSYYVSEIGEPRMEEDDGDRGKSSFFSYQRRMPEDIGVRISGRQGRSRVPSRIFNSLNGLAVQGVIPESRVNEIREKYSYLERCYFVSEKDESGKLVAADELIYKRYEEKIGAGGVESESSEEVMERAQQLMAQGRMQEATELLKKMQEGQLAGAELATSPRAAEMWVECLEELAASAYDVSITIYL